MITYTFFIQLVGISIASGIRKAGKDFIYSSRHNALLYQGKEHPIEQYNQIVPEVLERYKTYTHRLPVAVIVENVEAAEETPPVTSIVPPAQPGGGESDSPADPPVNEEEEPGEPIGLPPAPEGGEDTPPAEENQTEIPEPPKKRDRPSRAKPKDSTPVPMNPSTPAE
jgi:hypothetical protein